MWLNFFALENFANLVAVVDEEQVRVADETAHFGDFPVLLVEGQHQFVQFLDLVLS